MKFEYFSINKWRHSLDAKSSMNNNRKFIIIIIDALYSEIQLDINS